MSCGACFTGTIEMRILRDGRRILLSESVWRDMFDDPNSQTFTAPAGMNYDGPSIPPLFRVLYSPVIELAAAHHDALYALHADDDGTEISRATADRVMREISDVCQRRAREHMTPIRSRYARTLHFVQRWTIWAALTVAGRFAWDKSHGRKLYQTP